MRCSFAKHCALEIKVTGQLNATLKRYSNVAFKKLQTENFNLQSGNWKLRS